VSITARILRFPFRASALFCIEISFLHSRVDAIRFRYRSYDMKTVHDRVPEGAADRDLGLPTCISGRELAQRALMQAAEFEANRSFISAGS
jgi:hypothetical protein